ncbi:MAG: circadian clock KaiB family protein [Desulfobacterales bacterium]|nr:circadian clock KaiB family protein [Desulfobacterales bacterium]MDD3951328.1 circadian clock KaiB family protein [Desulfobacterales bacterium]
MYLIRLYIAGQTPKSLNAVSMIRNFLKSKFPDQSRLEIIDLLKNPELAEMDNVFATPTAVRLRPLPVRRVLGDFSDMQKVLDAFDLNQ